MSRTKPTPPAPRIDPMIAARDNAEREALLALLKAHDWSVSAASRASGVPRGTLHKRMRRLDVRMAARGPAT